MLSLCSLLTIAVACQQTHPWNAHAKSLPSHLLTTISHLMLAACFAACKAHKVSCRTSHHALLQTTSILIDRPADALVMHGCAAGREQHSQRDAGLELPGSFHSPGLCKGSAAPGAAGQQGSQAQSSAGENPLQDLGLDKMWHQHAANGMLGLD